MGEAWRSAPKVGELTMNKFKAALAAMAGAGLLSVSFASGAMAAPTGLTGPIQSYDPNFGSGHIATVKSYLETLTGKTVIYLGRMDGGSVDLGDDLAGTGASLTGTGLGGKSGTWTFDPGSSNDIVSFIEINGGSHGLLYDVDPDSNTGSWNTNDILNGGGKHPDLSHLDFWGIASSTSAVPEPAIWAMMLVGFGGLGAMLRYRRRDVATTA